MVIRFARLALFGIVATLIALSSRPAAAVTPSSGPDAYSQNKQLGRGVNVLGYDPIWKDREKARFQADYFKKIRAAGFDNVRIALHPFRDGAVGADDTIKAAWLETLDWAVKHALAAKLMVILDFHDYTIVNAPEAGKARYLAAWRQLADRYKGEPDSVLFELLNEPNGKLTAELWNEWLREVIPLVRQSNPKRTLIVGPGWWNSIDYLSKLELPKNDRKLIVTIHYYQPFPFTHQGTPWTDMRNKHGVVWKGSEEEHAAILKDFAKAREWSKKHDRPLFLGEFGAYDKGDMESRVRWTSFIARQAEKCEWSWAYWQFDNDFIVYDVKRDAWVEPIRRALVP